MQWPSTSMDQKLISSNLEDLEPPVMPELNETTFNLIDLDNEVRTLKKFDIETDEIVANSSRIESSDLKQNYINNETYPDANAINSRVGTVN